MKAIVALIALAITLIATPAEARKNQTHILADECNVTMPCTGGYYTPAAKRFIDIPFGVARQSYRSASIIDHPAGCPRRAFCGCGASVKIFGKPVRSLYLAAAWLRFPRATPAPGMAAARRGHVFVLEQHIGGNTWLVYDANSGRHQTRRHARSIAGYTVVNPHG